MRLLACRRENCRSKENAGIADSRRPLVVPTENTLAWLDPDLPGQEALERLAPVTAGSVLESRMVSDAAKRATNEGAGLIEAVVVS